MFRILVPIWVGIMMVAGMGLGQSYGKSGCRCGKTFQSDIAARVVRGTIMDQKAHPYLVQVRAGPGLCGGTIISHRYIMTAGHCVMRSNDIRVIAGLHNNRKREEHSVEYLPERVIQHPSYYTNGSLAFWDIALIKTRKIIEFNEYVQPICLPFNMNLSGVKSALIAGWGWMQENHGYTSQFPRGALLSILTERQCAKSYLHDVIPEYYPYFLCGYHKVSDTCQGDSGGPLIVLGKDGTTLFQIGITSFGKGCGRAGYPGAYTRVKAFLDWIKKHVKGDFCPPY